MTAPRSLATYLETRRTQIDRALDAALVAPPACPPIIGEAMRYSLFAGGKRLRPILVLATAEAVAERLTPERAQDATVERALPTACAIEMIHTYSLVHDDLPAMDDDDLRRGRPTAHVIYGEGLAILAGDGLLTEAFRVLADPPADDPAAAARALHALRVVARAAGAEGMVGGQAIDLQAIGSAPPADAAPAPLDAAGVTAMHARKTGALIRASAVAGAIVAGADESLIASVDTYAAELGLAFQIVDDILDVEGSAQEIGKTAGKDAAAGKPTYPSLHGLHASRRLAADGIARAKAALVAARLGGQLPALADWVVARTS